MPKRGYLGFSFPVFTGIIIVLVALTVVSLLSGGLGKSMLGDVGLPAWLSVDEPHPELPAETVFHLLGFSITNTLITAWISIALLVAVAYTATRRMRLVPNRLQTIVELVVGRLLEFCQDIAGEKYGRRFFPMVATIFFFVIANAWLSLIPGYGSILVTNPEGEVVNLLRGANTDINFPLALALISFVFVEFWGVKSVGMFRYLGKFFNGRQFFGAIRRIFSGRVREGLGGLFFGVIDIFIGLIELLSEFIRILSFTFRLFGNMTGGEILLLTMLFLAPFVLAIPFYGLELLVGFIQALIFGGLTLVFATIAVTPHHVEEKH